MKTMLINNVVATRSAVTKAVVLTTSGNVVMQTHFGTEGAGQVAKIGDLVISITASNKGLVRKCERMTSAGLIQEHRRSYIDMFDSLLSDVQDFMDEVTVGDGVLPMQYVDTEAYEAWSQKDERKTSLQKAQEDFMSSGLQAIGEAYAGDAVRGTSRLIVGLCNAVDNAWDKLPVSSNEFEQVFNNHGTSAVKAATRAGRAFGKLIGDFADKFYPTV